MEKWRPAEERDITEHIRREAREYVHHSCTGGEGARYSHVGRELSLTEQEFEGRLRTFIVQSSTSLTFVYKENGVHSITCFT